MSDVTPETPAVRLARAKAEAAKLRTRAAHQEAMAAGYARQADKPAYSGQEQVCMGKHGEVIALAAENRAKADLIEAEAQAVYDAEMSK